MILRHVIPLLERSLAPGSYTEVYEHWRHSVSREKYVIFYRIWPLCLLCSESAHNMCVFFQCYFLSRCEIQAHLPVSGSRLEDAVCWGITSLASTESAHQLSYSSRSASSTIKSGSLQQENKLAFPKPIENSEHIIVSTLEDL